MHDGFVKRGEDDVEEEYVTQEPRGAVGHEIELVGGKPALQEQHVGQQYVGWMVQAEPDVEGEHEEEGEQMERIDLGELPDEEWPGAERALTYAFGIGKREDESAEDEEERDSAFASELEGACHEV